MDEAFLMKQFEANTCQAWKEDALMQSSQNHQERNSKIFGTNEYLRKDHSFWNDMER